MTYWLQTNITVKWLAVLIRIREYLYSNLGMKTGFLIWVFMVFLSSFRQMLGYNLKISDDRFRSYVFYFTNHPIIWRYIHYTVEKASLIEQNSIDWFFGALNDAVSTEVSNECVDYHC
jgi:hypothetical protein